MALIIADDHVKQLLTMPDAIDMAEMAVRELQPVILPVRMPRL